MDIYEELLKLKREGRRCALAVIVQCVGSAPQKEGAKMLVREDGSILGTLGGGYIEAEVIQASLRAMEGSSPRTLPVSMTENPEGLACGGEVLVYIEPVIPDPELVILGAGHVGKALASVATLTGLRVTVVDDREEYASKEHLPEAHKIILHDFNTPFSQVDVGRGTYIVIATRGHNHDLDALRSALRTEAGYIGLVGSRRKKEVLFRMLSEEGVSADELGRVIVPVGLPLGAVTPQEIAVSIMAQIIEQRRSGVSSGVGSAACSGPVKEDGEIKAASAPR